MTETIGNLEAAAAPTAGSLLRQARQARGLHIAALASAIKVAPRKLELLESDRLDELPDATFTRALAQTVCRSLKVDAVPILDLLPRAPGHRLEQVSEGLNAPFMERPGRMPAAAGLVRPAWWALGLVLAVVAAVAFVPTRWLPRSSSGDAASSEAAPVPPPGAASGSAAILSSAGAPVPPASAALALPAVASTNPATVAQAADPAGRGASSSSVNIPPPFMAGSSDVGIGGAGAAAGVVASGSLHLQTSADSWIEVRDSNGQPLIARLVKAGERVELEGAVPLRLNIGNAAATQVVFRGEPLSLEPFTRGNLARLELK
jgi:cytoskeleton protein RodZ